MTHDENNTVIAIFKNLFQVLFITSFYKNLFIGSI